MKGTVRKDAKVPANTVRIITGRLGGQWLKKLGFTPGDVLMVDTSPGVITYRLQENGVARTLELVKFARAHKLRLIQVLTRGHGPFIEIPRSCLKRAGLMPDETLYAICEPDKPGTLKLQRSDLS